MSLIVIFCPDNSLKKYTKKIITLTLFQMKNFFSKFLLFNQSFNKDWKAYSGNSKKPLPHVASGYANAWDISKTSDRKITVVFSRQDLIVKNILISVAAFFIVLFIFLKIKK